LGLMDIGISGPLYTWSNHRKGAALVQARLDRVLVSPQWLNSFKNAQLKNLPPFASDHSPVLLLTDQQETQLHRLYKFYKCWLSHPTCKAVIDTSWQKEVRGSPPYQIVQKLHNTKCSLRRWKRTEFGHIETQIATTKEKIQVCQQHPHL
ncbi:hypothetical protein MKW92_015957, partial [Papaver armeniacum]